MSRDTFHKSASAAAAFGIEKAVALCWCPPTHCSLALTRTMSLTMFEMSSLTLPRSPDWSSSPRSSDAELVPEALQKVPPDCANRRAPIHLHVAICRVCAPTLPNWSVPRIPPAGKQSVAHLLTAPPPPLDCCQTIFFGSKLREKFANASRCRKYCGDRDPFRKINFQGSPLPNDTLPRFGTETFPNDKLPSFGTEAPSRSP